MRQKYERHDHRLLERAVAKHYAMCVNLLEVEFPEKSVCDRVLFDWNGCITAIFEVKVRKDVRRSQYDTYMLSEGKVNACRHMGALLQVPALLVVGWKDEVGVIDMRKAPVAEVKIGGRWDRGDKLDREPCVYFPISAFETVSKGDLPPIEDEQEAAA